MVLFLPDDFESASCSQQKMVSGYLVELSWKIMGRASTDQECEEHIY